MEQNKFIENYCSSITPFQRDMGTSPANAKGVGLCPIHMKSTTVKAVIVFINSTFLNNFALSKGFFFFIVLTINIFRDECLYSFGSSLV